MNAIAKELSGCFMVGNVEFAGQGRADDKRRAEAFAKLMNCTPEQVQAQLSKNARQLYVMAWKAKSTGKLVNGYTAEQLEALADKAKGLACAS